MGPKSLMRLPCSQASVNNASGTTGTPALLASLMPMVLNFAGLNSVVRVLWGKTMTEIPLCRQIGIQGTGSRQKGVRPFIIAFRHRSSQNSARQAKNSASVPAQKKLFFIRICTRQNRFFVLLRPVFRFPHFRPPVIRFRHSKLRRDAALSSALPRFCIKSSCKSIRQSRLKKQGRI